MEERRNPTFNSRYSNSSRNKFLSNEGPSNSSNKYRRQITTPPNLPQKPNPNLDLGRQRTTPNLPQRPTNPNLDLDLVKRIEFLINQDPRDLLRKLDELRDQLSRSCEISERPNRERERQIPVSRRTLSSSFRRQNPGNENPGNHFPVSNSYCSNPSREHEKYRKVRLPPRDNYSQYNSIKTRENYNYNYNYNNNYNHYGVEENYGFAPVDRQLLGSQEYERRSLNGSVYSADWASQRSESSKRRAKRSFLPLNGASPFAICDACFSLLQIPSGFVFNKGKKMLNFKCGNCSEVINIKISDQKIDSSFSTGSSQNWNYQNYDSLRERRVYSKDVNPVSLSTEMEEREYDYGYDKFDKSSGFLEASGSFSHEREVLEHLFNTQEKRKSLVLSEEIEEKREELERSSEDIKEAVEIEPLMNRFISDKNIHEEKLEEFNAIIDGTDLGNDKEEMERSSSVSERNLNDAALNEDINALHVEGAENKEEMEASSLDEFKREINGENVEKSSLDEFKGEINRENVENKEQMEISIPESEPLVNGLVFEDNSESIERSIKDEIENSESIERSTKNEKLEEMEKDENSDEMERFMKDEMERFITDEMERFIKDENSEQIERYIKNENSEQIERSIKDENAERIERLVTDKSSEEMERSFKDEISEEMERSIRVDSVNSEETGRSIRAGSVNSEETQKSIRVDSVNSEEMERSIREIDRSLRVDSVNSEEMERSIRVDSVNSSSNRGSSRSSLDEEQGAVISRNGDSSFLGGLIKKSFKDFSLFNSSPEGSKCKVFVNGHPISERAVKRAEKKAGPIDPGNYWYDYHAGFWGVMGHECLGIIPPFIREFNYPMLRDCAGGRTGVVVNGRELHRKDLEVLVRRGLPATSARAYAIEMSGKVVDVASGRELKNLGKLAPTIEILKHGFGMLVPQDLS